MASGFATWKDVIEVVAVPFALAILALVWPAIESFYKCRRFRRLVARELEEMSPYTEKPVADWTGYLEKSFLHRKIIDAVSDNRDFILGLDPDFVYALSQLWSAYEAKNPRQWLHFLGALAEHRYTAGRRERIAEVVQNWRRFLAEAEKADAQTDSAGK